eukprot:gnl/TRDRNA2_/TRDRNA2_157342_c1_seq1.p1 gnl/TRDRNA2_/TRDRNA2_157342_c1~~gnl/TRDRNA2_/TRDRNA2_157342_c1_seq1.p1  ORF type:complete len:390 (+),score=70.35 gnl/TRDRNA2_/TRDRNA2_157342_c1_seq1:37-1170(+)
MGAADEPDVAALPQEAVAGGDAAFVAAAASLEQMRRLPTAELRRRRCGSRRDSEGSELHTGALEEAEKQLLTASDILATASRSLRFFERALAATRGEASAEHRTCSICLDEDIPAQELSITVCAHVFHTACIAEVAAKFGTCPECRHKIDVSKDITALSAELAAADQVQQVAGRVPRTGKRRRDAACSGSVLEPSCSSSPEIAKRFGSKLAAIAARLREIGRAGEKVIVFCQWEDLKRKVADSLGVLGITHFQLTGNVYQRSEVIRRFQEERGEGSTHVLLLSLEHSASGTNLTAANHVVFVHPMSAVSAEKAVSYEAQAIGRCRRWGQERPEVHCWRFVVRGTVEEAITAEHQRELWKHHLQCAPSPAQQRGVGGC